MRRASKILRVQGIPKEDVRLKEKEHEIYNLGHIVSYNACKDMVRILYLDLDLFHLQPLEKNINKLLAKIGEVSSEARID